jgi:hypothetical protein
MPYTVSLIPRSVCIWSFRESNIDPVDVGQDVTRKQKGERRQVTLL